MKIMQFGGSGGVIENLPEQPTNFRTILHHGSKSVVLKWENPADENFSAVKIVRKTGSAPENMNDGKVIYEGSDETYTDADAILEYGTKYYYRIFALNGNGQPQTMPDKCIKDTTVYDYSAGVYLSDLEVGAEIIFGRYKQTDTAEATELRWKVVDKQYAADGIITVAQETDLGNKIFDAGETGNTNNRQYGNNRWLYSNIRQWLNSDAAGGKWYTAQHEFDQPPSDYRNHNGFLRAFTADEKLCILIKTNNLRLAKCDGVGTETLNDDMWLASAYEVGLAGTDGTLTCEKYPDTQQIYSYFAETGGKIWHNKSWWSRSLNANNGNRIRCVSADGGLADNSGSTACGARAFCYLSSSIVLEWSDEKQAYIYVMKESAE